MNTEFRIVFWGLLILCVLPFCAWLTHVIVCIWAGAWGILIAGAIVFPVAVVHGIMIWFGVGWV